MLVILKTEAVEGNLNTNKNTLVMVLINYSLDYVS